MQDFSFLIRIGGVVIGIVVIVVVPLIVFCLATRTGRMVTLMLLLCLSYLHLCLGAYFTKTILDGRQGYPLSDLTAQSFDVFMKQWRRLIDSGSKEQEKSYLEAAYLLRSHLCIGPEKDTKAFEFYEWWENVIENSKPNGDISKRVD